jgi:hypothetical protein
MTSPGEHTHVEQDPEPVMSDTEKKPKTKRGGSKPILKNSGVGRVDNGLKSTLFVQGTMINQKNYYT